ncbi:MAG: hypothetical protein K0R36_925 [Chryseobacterium sp.]|jgi:predicted ester cyclase|nr:hypothetical protein [Chryseobacterium sp.]
MNNQNETNMVEAISLETLEAIEAFYKAWQTNDLTIIDDLFNADWQDIPMAPEQKEGSEGLKDLMTFFHQTFPDIEVTIQDIFGTAERIAVRAEMTFTHDKELMDIQPVDKKVRITILELHHLTNGKITHTWHLEDWFGLFMQSRSLKNQ